MEQQEIRELLTRVSRGEMPVEEAVLKLKEQPFEELGYAKLDHHRALRQGAAEVIYGAGKTAKQIIGILSAMERHGQKTVLVTRLSPEKAEEIQKVHALRYDEMGRIGIMGQMLSLIHI